MSGKKIIDAKNDSEGNIKSVLLEGNQSFTPIESAIRMADSGKIDAVAVHPSKSKDHIRAKPDSIKKNNLDQLAKD